jgi:cyclopropane-fatty-acyl-phospholipid synthase
MRFLIDRAVSLAERGRLPDAWVRWGIRRVARRRLATEERREEATGGRAVDAFLEAMRDAPVAAVPEKANEQHYEVPAEFFRLVLGPRLKYSCAHWGEGVETLAEAEESALGITAVRAGLEDGQDVLDLGCGWGSLSLFAAERFPASRILAVSNSASQRRFVEARAAERGLGNLRVVTADVNEFRPDRRFDRVVSVEMLEHVRNHEELLRRVAGWLRSDGRAFVHVFCHRHHAYAFEADGPLDWMARRFFTGGIMPSADLFDRVDADLRVTEGWWWGGTHYRRTAEAWLANLDARRDEARRVLAGCVGEAEADRALHRWRLFFLVCAEVFGYRDGREWGVVHRVLEPVRSRSEVAA